MLMRAAIALMMALTAACTAGPSDGTAPDVGESHAAELQARAIWRACNEVICAGAPIYAPDSTPELTRTALLQFTDEIQYLSGEEVEAATSPDNRFGDGATMFEAGVPHDMERAAVVGVDVWISKGFQDAVRRTYLFAWDGEGWADTTPDASGVTVTSSVS
jgi:hypothetical protein